MPSVISSYNRRSARQLKGCRTALCGPAEYLLRFYTAMTTGRQSVSNPTANMTSARHPRVSLPSKLAASAGEKRRLASRSGSPRTARSAHSTSSPTSTSSATANPAAMIQRSAHALLEY